MWRTQIHYHIRSSLKVHQYNGIVHKHRIPWRVLPLNGTLLFQNQAQTQQKQILLSRVPFVKALVKIKVQRMFSQTQMLAHCSLLAKILCVFHRLQCCTPLFSFKISYKGLSEKKRELTFFFSLSDKVGGMLTEACSQDLFIEFSETASDFEKHLERQLNSGGQNSCLLLHTQIMPPWESCRWLHNFLAWLAFSKIFKLVVQL